MSDVHGVPDEVRARQHRSIITISLVVLALFFAAWYAYSYIRADDARSAREAATATPTTTACEMTPEQVEVNVYNATSRPGLAAQVATDLRKRGFVVETVANDPKRAELTGRGELRYGETSLEAARLVEQHVGSFAKKVDERQRTSVDVVLGPTYDQLVDRADITPC